MKHSPLGPLLREWRNARRMSQLALAMEAGMSTRHLSFVETGKAQASREAIQQLAGSRGEIHPPRTRATGRLADGPGVAAVGRGRVALPRRARTLASTRLADRARARVDARVPQQRR